MNPAFSAEQLSAARERITQSGKPITVWAREQGLDYGIVSHTLLGRTKGLRGEAFRAAVALGLRKAPPKKRSKARTQPGAAQAAA